MTQARPPATPASVSNADSPASPSTVPEANQPAAQTCTTCKDKRVIVIDPGHGGSAMVGGSSPNNATAVSGTKEKTLTLQYAQSLKQHLDGEACKAIFRGRGYADVQVILTRTGDVNPGLSARVNVAKTNKADIFLSIHFNGGVAAARGTETFYKAGSNGNANLGEDTALAQTVQTALFGAMKRIDAGAKDRKIKPDTDTKHKSLGILRDPGIGYSGKMCRSVLIEVEFISNVQVDALLVSGGGASSNRSTLMLAVARALANSL
ncbi:MAG TPA: N-acetylmuramoyl-L-alanine amidase [Polyangium sp.]|nr:N-acetylmuramoyl-L-alanine amidase [Polyangium sp.]